MAGRAIMALLLFSVMITGTSNAMETTELDDSVGIANANEDVKSSTFLGFWGWGPPIKWWPISFCSWDYWTSAVWQVTLAGKFVTCNSPAARATGTALAGLGSRTIGRNARVQNILKGVRWNPLSTTPVLCAQRGGQMIFTYSAPANAYFCHEPIAVYRGNSGDEICLQCFQLPHFKAIR